jgi:putative FmdB family regulatory protein
MPIYEYRCDGCANTFEVLTSFAERELGFACPACESRQTRLLVSSFARTGGAGGESPAPMDFGGGGGGCACGGSCSCRN